MTGLFTCSSPTNLSLSDVHLAIHERAARKHDSTTMNNCPETGSHSDNHSSFDLYTRDTILPKVDIGRLFEHSSPLCGEQVAIILGTRAPHGRALATVQHPELDRATVAYDPGIASNGIYFPHDLALRNTTHCRVAAHLANDAHIHGHQQDFRSHVSSSSSGLTAGVPTSHYHNVVWLRIVHVFHVERSFVDP